MVKKAQVPIGPHAHRWHTVRPERFVLLIAHNVTTVTRLLDVIPAFDNDPRVQLVFTRVGGDPFQHGLDEAMAGTDVVVIPWKQAKNHRFDLAIAASNHGKLHQLTSPLVILSHGIGYTKYSPGEPGSRGAGEPGSRGAFGLSPESVLHQGKPLAAAYVLSHESQRGQIAPPAAPFAFVGGDPSFDRILASTELRHRYRRALGVENRRLILVSSTWHHHSAIATRTTLLRKLLAELPRDTWAVAIAFHPNLSHGHGPGTVEAWFRDCLDSGLLHLPEIEGWQAGLIAADVVIGDHGSVTGYAAALGKPTLLASFDEVPPATPIAELGARAPRLAARGPFLPQLTAAIEEHQPGTFAEVTAQVTSIPGRSLEALRALFYRLMPLDEPGTRVSVRTVPPPQIQRPTVFADLVTGTVDETARLVSLTRRPAGVQRTDDLDEDNAHISCSIDYPDRHVRSLAAVQAIPAADTGPDENAWHQGLLERRRHIAMSVVLDRNSARIRLRDGTALTLTSPDAPAEALASAAYLWHAHGFPWAPLTLTLGERTHVIELA